MRNRERKRFLPLDGHHIVFTNNKNVMVQCHKTLVIVIERKVVQWRLFVACRATVELNKDKNG